MVRSLCRAAHVDLSSLLLPRFPTYTDHREEISKWTELVPAMHRLHAPVQTESLEETEREGTPFPSAYSIVSLHPHLMFLLLHANPGGRRPPSPAQGAATCTLGVAYAHVHTQTSFLASNKERIPRCIVSCLLPGDGCAMGRSSESYLGVRQWFSPPSSRGEEESSNGVKSQSPLPCSPGLTPSHPRLAQFYVP